jgi:hypothetical protein
MASASSTEELFPRKISGGTGFQPVLTQAEACGYHFLVPKLLLGNVIFCRSSCFGNLDGALLYLIN